MSRQDFARQYLFSLVLKWEELEAERQELLAAATRITAIQAEKAELLSDAQDALAKYNKVFGTSYTLPQVRAWYNAQMKMIVPTPPTALLPDVVGSLEAAAVAAVQAAGFITSVVPVPHETVPVGEVISQTPSGGTMQTVGSGVSLVVSTGPVTP